MAKTTAPQFVHLHLHSQYSLLDGGNRLDRLVARVKELGMDAVAVTDHGNLLGAAEFYTRAKDAGIKPILGIEAYVAPDLEGKPSDRTSREYTGVADGGFHLVLLAENMDGWKHLLKLISDANIHGFYFKPRMDKATLRQWSKGLIAINGHLGSSIAHHLMQYVKTSNEKHYQTALEEARWHKETFGTNEQGEPCFYIELQRHAVKEQIDINPHLIRIADELDLPLVADNDAHFLHEEDWDAHDTLCCISMQKIKTEQNRLRYPKELFVKSPQEMWEAFTGANCEVPEERSREAFTNTCKIADRCNVELDFSANHAPVVNIAKRAEPAGTKTENFPIGSTEWFKAFCSRYELQPFDSSNEQLFEADLKAVCDEALRELTEAGAIWRYGKDGITPEIRARMDRELKILADKSISAYFLIVWDFCNESRRRGIPVNARGSGVGTMVGYCLGLSNACPVKYGLLFERFTDPDRSEYPDIDIDICQDGRQEIIEYVRQKYGHVAQIITYGTLKARAAVRDVGRVLDVPLNEVENICKLIGDGLKTTIGSALEQEPELKKLYDSNPIHREMIDTAKKLEGMARHTGVHAAGVIVATQPLENIVPLCRATNSKQEEPQIVTQWDGPTCEKAGLLKMDFLGLRTLSIIERAKLLIQQTLTPETVRATINTGRARHGKNPLPDTIDPLDLDRLTFDDPNVFALFQRGETAGVFQFESGGMRNLLVAMRPDRLEDLIAANALYRPGPMDLIPDYNDRKHGRQIVPKVHPIVDQFTQETHGIMIYQEQVMQILHELGDIPLREAYAIIKAISKKKEKVINAARDKFIEGAVKKDLPKEKGDELFDLILKFAGYGFNKSHSTGYAIVAYQTAFLKTYFPVQYMAALLTFEAVSTDKVVSYMDECKRVTKPDGTQGIEVRPPDINLSDVGFTVTYDPNEPREAHTGHIRFGLTAVKGVGERAVLAILDGREVKRKTREQAKQATGSKSKKNTRHELIGFQNLHDFCQNVSLQAVNRSTVEALIKCGAFDSMHGLEKRAALVAALDDAIKVGQRAAKDRVSGQSSFFEVFEEVQAGASVSGGASEDVALPNVSPWDTQEVLQHEHSVLGFYLSSHPLDEYSSLTARYTTCPLSEAATLRAAEEVIVAGMVTCRLVNTRKGDKMAIVNLQDGINTMEGVLFPKTYAKQYSYLQTGEDGNLILFVRGKIDRRREQPQLVVDQLIRPGEVASILTRAIHIRMQAPEGTQDHPLNGEVNELKEVLRQELVRGSMPEGHTAARVIIDIVQRDKRVVLELPNMRVRVTSQLISSIHTVLNHDGLQLARCELRGPDRFHLNNGDQFRLHDGSRPEQLIPMNSRQQEGVCASVDRY